MIQLACNPSMHALLLLLKLWKIYLRNITLNIITKGKKEANQTLSFVILWLQLKGVSQSAKLKRNKNNQINMRGIEFLELRSNLLTKLFSSAFNHQHSNRNFQVYYKFSGSTLPKPLRIRVSIKSQNFCINSLTRY